MALETGALDPATLPTVLLVFAVLITHLGNPVAVTVIPVGLYWLVPRRIPRFTIERRQAVTLLGVLMCSTALVEIGKTIIDVPRPPTAGSAAMELGISHTLAGLSEQSLTRGANSFPSGHVVAATVLWGGLGVLVEGSRWRRAAVAAVLVTLVAGSRLVLGLHYPTDFLGALALGTGLLAAIWWVDRTDHGPELALLGALLAALLSLPLAGVRSETVAMAGAMGGAILAWWWLGDASLRADSGWPALVAGLGGVAPVLVLVELTDATLVTAAAAAVAAAWVLASPLFVSAVVRPRIEAFVTR